MQNRIFLQALLVILIAIPPLTTLAQVFESIEDGVIQGTIGDSQYLIDVEGNQTGFPGAIYQANRIYDNYTYQIGAMQFCAIGFQDSMTMIPMEFSGMDFLNDSTVSIFSTGPDELGLGSLNASMNWTKDGEWLRYELIVTATDTVHFLNNFQFYYTAPGFRQFQFINGREIITRDIPNVYSYVINLQNGIVMEGELLTIESFIDNPFYGRYQSDIRGITNDICQTMQPVSSWSEGPIVHSVIAEGDTIRRSGIIRVIHREEPRYASNGFFAAFSPHSYASDCSIVTVVDDFPISSNYRVMTTSSDEDNPLESRLVQLFEDNPDFKMTVVVLLDGIIQFPANRSLEGGWTLDAANISLYPFEASNGDQSLRMEVASDTFCTIRRTIDLNENDNISLALNYSPLEEIEQGNGLSFVVHNADSSEYYESVIEGYGSSVGSWYSMNYEVPPVINFDEYTIRIKNNGSTLLIDQFGLELNGNLVSVVNSDFENGSTYISYETPTNSWWGAHGVRNLREAPEEYLDFLDRLQSDRLDYGYEDRVDLGLHGYHHTPHGKFLGYGPSWEWSYNIAQWQDEAMDSTVSAAIQIGMDEGSRWAFRSPGLQYHHLTAQACVRYGVRWMDCGFGISTAYFSPFYGPGGAVWLQSLQQWLDNPEAYLAELNHSRTILDRGGIAEWGFHPYAALNLGTDEERYAWLCGLIETIEYEYPYLTWDTPRKVIKRIDYIENSSFVTVRQNRDSLLLRFSGEYKDGLTIISYLGSDIQLADIAYVDDVYEIQVDQRDDKAFFILPDLEDGDHTIAIHITNYIDPPGTIPVEPELKVWPVPSNGDIQVKWRHPSLTSEVEIRLYNLLGQEVSYHNIRPEAYTVRTSLQTEGLASGVYFIKLKQEENSLLEMKKVILLK